ncbi:MAG: low molecular weight protein arginine phosphatase [Chthoniobacterales bacterium]|nr:low molecular weight protein arginine phosphatase [Chthoniobacterales bacterium]
MKKILFVCTGNTCRSPMAEALFHKMTQERSDLRASSAGLQATRGAAATSFALKALAKEGIDFSSFKSKPVTAELIQEATIVFAMTEDHLFALLQRYPEHQQKFFLLNENQEIMDPIGGGLSNYQECCIMIQSSLKRILLENL